MGYYTDFSGSFRIKELISRKEIEYFNRFCNTRHMRLNTECLKKNFPNEVEKYSLNGNLGFEGMWYAPGNLGPDFGNSFVLDGNHCSSEILKISENKSLYPSMLWCDFVLDPVDGYEKLKDKNIDKFECILNHDGAEKSYDYYEWLVFLCKTLLKNYDVNGVMVAMGEETGDRNIIVIIHTTPSLLHSQSDTETFINNSNITSEEKELLLSELYTRYFEPDWWYEDDEDEY